MIGGHIFASISAFSESHNLLVEKGLDSWDFDLFEASEMMQGKPLFVLGTAIFRHFEVTSTIDVEDLVLYKFLEIMDEKYLPNPYHNSTHAADVLQGVCCFIFNSIVIFVF